MTRHRGEPTECSRKSSFTGFGLTIGEDGKSRRDVWTGKRSQRIESFIIESGVWTSVRGRGKKGRGIVSLLRQVR